MSIVLFLVRPLGVEDQFFFEKRLDKYNISITSSILDLEVSLVRVWGDLQDPKTSPRRKTRVIISKFDFFR